MFKDPSRETDYDEKDTNSNPLYSGMNQDPNALIVSPSTSPTLQGSASMSASSIQLEAALQQAQQQQQTTPKKSGGLFARIKAFSNSGGSQQSKQKPRLLLSRIRENRLSRKEVISDTNDMSIKKLVKHYFYCQLPSSPYLLLTVHKRGCPKCNRFTPIISLL